MENQGNRSNSQDSFPENLRKQTVLRGSVSLSEEHRFRCIEISFSAQEGGRERLALELPLRVKRTEARGVAEGLACINAHLEDCEAFMLAPVSGKISLEMIAEGGSEEARSSSVADAFGNSRAIFRGNPGAGGYGNNRRGLPGTGRGAGAVPRGEKAVSARPDFQAPRHCGRLTPPSSD